MTFREWMDSYHGSKWWHGETGYTEEDMLAAWEASRQSGQDPEA